MENVFHGHSYTGNPLGCAVALANLEIFKREQTLTQVRKKSRLLARLLQPLAELTHVGDIRQRGFMVGIEFVQDRHTKTPYPLEHRMGYRVAQACRLRGLLLRPLGNVMALILPSPSHLGTHQDGGNFVQCDSRDDREFSAST